MNKPPVIRIVKKKHVAAAHHGGSWKVAYADFVTAMMAFFLVLWLLSMDEQLKQQIQNYFNDPYTTSNSMAGISKLAAGGKSPLASGSIGMNAKNWHELALEAQQQRFLHVQEALEREIAGRPDLAQLGQHVQIRVTKSGLSIELIEAERPLFFESGSTALPPATRKMLALIAGYLGRLANPIAIEGHTDVVPYRGGAAYSNWELSTDRANAARRAMEATGLRPHQVVEVRGCADNQLRDPKHPRNPANRRVSIVVNYNEDKPPSPLMDDSGARKPQSESDRLPFAVDIKPGIEPGH